MKYTHLDTAEKPPHPGAKSLSKKFSFSENGMIPLIQFIFVISICTALSSMETQLLQTLHVDMVWVSMGQPRLVAYDCAGTIAQKSNVQ